MIEAVTGLNGGGKTVKCLYRMLDCFSKGGTVFTNICLAGFDPDTKEFSEDAPIRQFLRDRAGWEFIPAQYVYLDESQCKYLHKHIKKGTENNQVVVVIDEALEWLDSLDRYSLSNDDVAGNK